MQRLLYANLSTLNLAETLADGGSDTSFPPMVAGTHLTLRLRLAETLEGTPALSNRTVHSVKASIGLPDARPASGTYQLTIGPGAAVAGVNTTGSIAYSASGEALAAAINALTDATLVANALPCKVVLEDGSYRIRFKDAAQRDFDCADNALWPLSFVEVTASEHDEGWIHTLRLVQAPLAQTVDHALTLAATPVISRVQEGGGDEASGATWNELQKLSIPAEFNVGAIQIRRGFLRSDAIGLPTSGEEIQTALAAIADEGGTFIVTEQQNAVLIEFAGDSMKGRSQSLLELEIIEGPLPSIQFTLDTDTAAMAVRMQKPDSIGQVALPLEISLTIEDAENPEILHPVAFRADLVFLNSINTAARSVAATPNWNQPFARRNYRQYGPDQFLIGQRHARFIIGDGTATSYTLNHNLGDGDITVAVRDNDASGRLLRDAEYEVNFDGDNALVVTFEIPVEENSLVVLISTVSHPASFLAHTHTIDDVEELRVRLEAIENQLAQLTAIAPSGGLTVDTSTTDEALIIAEWSLMPMADIYPTRFSWNLQEPGKTTATAPKAIAEIKPQVLYDLNIRDGGLLPAIHRATTYDMIAPESVTGDYEGNVYENKTEQDIILPGKGGRRKDTLSPGEFAAYNGSRWYKVRKDGDTTSFFPTQFERKLFEFSVNERQLRFKKTLSLDFGFEVAILTNRIGAPSEYANSPFNTEAQWSLLVEWGEYVQDEAAFDEDSPEYPDTAQNLSLINWHKEAPIIDHTFNLTVTPTIHQFGVEIIRNAAGKISANRILYGGKEGTNAPTSGNFALRARLTRFDTENIWNPLGLVVLLGLDRQTGTAISTMGKAQIK